MSEECGEAPARGFPAAEYQARVERARERMSAARLDALLVTTPANVRYFSGFDSQFWASPTRPWFLVVPRRADPIAVIPEIGVPGMARTWVEAIRSWPAPRPEDDGVSLLAATLAEVAGEHGRVGAELGRESCLRMPVADLERLRERARGVELVDGAELLHALRAVKSEAEIGRIGHVCALASDAFAALPGRLRAGMSEREACRRLRIELLERGADDSPYLMGASGPGGYAEIIMGPGERRLSRGDVLIIDTGTTFDGYFCDFDRNFAFGAPDDALRRAHETLWQATEAGIAAARPGATAEQVWQAQQAVLEAAGAAAGNVGRLGHGLGLQLTEPPSLRRGDHTVLEPGMVLTIEPGLTIAPGRMLVHEEDLVVREDGAELLTRRAPRELVVIEG